MAEWIKDQFQNQMLFRRLYLVFMGAYVAMVTWHSFQYLLIATNIGVSSIDIVANLTAVVAFPTYVMKILYERYTEDRK